MTPTPYIEPVAQTEATEDFHKVGGSLGNFALSMKEATIPLLYRKRVFWLVFTNFFSGASIPYFEALITTKGGIGYFSCRC